MRWANLGGVGGGYPLKSHLAHQQAELGISHMCHGGSNPHDSGMLVEPYRIRDLNHSQPQATHSEPKKRGNSYKKIFMEVIEHGMIR